MAALAIITAIPGAGFAQSGPGAYLAGRQAAQDSDFASAVQYYTRALTQDRDNADLMESVTASQLALGQIERALPVAKHLEQLGLKSQVAHMVVTANLIAAGDYDALLARDLEKVGIGPLVDGLIKGWAHLGAGSQALALEQFDSVSAESGLRGFALYHKAMALALVGDFQAADAIFDAENGRLTSMARRAALARVQILSQLGRNVDALDLLAETFDGVFDPGLTDVADRLVSGEKLEFDHVTSVQDGMAEVFYIIGAALAGETAGDYALIYARLAGYLRPDHIDALLLSAEILDDLGQYTLAVETYKQVPFGSPEHNAAELGRAEALRRAAKPDAAIEVLERLAKDFPNLPRVYSALGDLQRQQENYVAAIKAYDRALEYTERDVRGRWFLLYARGISFERLDMWEQSEADFRAALELSPDQPQVLNYLGYSLVEKQSNLDEALDMIQRAVAARPDSGYIVDSLGWVLYRLGRYDEAVRHMEKAVELMAVDPVVNDHLGDVFWAVGRFREARFQWKRALSFVDPEDADAEADPVRIRRKIEVGLDVVLAEEGAEPLKVADEDG
ncbi:MAG: tetratricopeptide repeat protein [Rhodobacteraceae bacterium]|nr:tetratricopeptide repeat protein [Paracoccaceae bacterium]